MALNDWRYPLPSHATLTTRSASANGSGRRSTALSTLKIALFAPIPSANVRTTIAVNRAP